MPSFLSLILTRAITTVIVCARDLVKHTPTRLMAKLLTVYPISDVDVVDVCTSGCHLAACYLRTSLGNVRASAARRCHACGLVRDAIEAFSCGIEDLTEVWIQCFQSRVEIVYPIEPLRGVEEDHGLSDIRRLSDASCVEEDIPDKLLNDHDRLSKIKLTLYGEDVDDLSPISYFKALPLSKLSAITCDTSCAAAVQKVQHWYGNCMKYHHSCRTWESQPLPRWILDVRPSRRCDHIRLKCNGKGKGTYVTLSHCWGHSQIMKLTKDNIKNFQQCIKLQDLPLTFRDAVTVTRKLGIRYLWIDSLCIVQDDKEDWERIANKMADIYGKSTLTVAASAATRADGGLFRRVGDDFKLKRIGLTQLDGTTTDVYMRRTIPHPQFGNGDGFPLLSRAWAYQERLLTRRILHFGPQELSWECRKSRTCECDFWPKDSDSDNKNVLSKSLFWQWSNKSGLEEASLTLWAQIVSHYSRLKLTYASDIFTALAGLARPLQSSIDGEYIAGIWFTEHIAVHLLWHTEPQGISVAGSHYPAGLGVRPDPRRAPTWSWASIRSAIDFPNFTEWGSFRRLWDQISFRRELLNQFTGVMNGVLYITAPLVALELRKAGAGHFERYNTWRNRGNCVSFLDGEPFNDVELRLDYDVSAEGPDCLEKGTAVALVLIGRSCSIYQFDKVKEEGRKKGREDGLEECERSHYLLLRKLQQGPIILTHDEEPVEGLYERIGVAKMSLLREIENVSDAHRRVWKGPLMHIGII